MKHFIEGAAKRLAFSLLTASVLGGCAVYVPAGSYGPNQYGPPAYYSQPGYAPYPVYAGPPLFFDFGYWFGGHRDRGDHGGHFDGGHGRHR